MVKAMTCRNHSPTRNKKAKGYFSQQDKPPIGSRMHVMTQKKLTKKNNPTIGKNAVMALSFGALNLADYMTTKYILNSGGEELNPIARFLMKRNLWGFSKIVTATVGMLLAYQDKNVGITTKLMVGSYGYLVGHNLKEIVTHKIRATQDRER